MGVGSDSQLIDIKRDCERVCKKLIFSCLAALQLPESAIIIQGSAINSNQILEFASSRSRRIESLDMLKTHILMRHSLCAVILD